MNKPHNGINQNYISSCIVNYANNNFNKNIPMRLPKLKDKNKVQFKVKLSVNEMDVIMDSLYDREINNDGLDKNEKRVSRKLIKVLVPFYKVERKKQNIISKHEEKELQKKQREQDIKQAEKAGYNMDEIYYNDRMGIA